MMGEAFPRVLRLRRARDFARVYQRNIFAADDQLVVKICENSCGHPRLGLSVSRRVGNAVCRNRWKRCIREAFRRQRERLPADLDVIVIPRRGAVPNAARIADSLVRLTHRAGQRLRRGTAAPEAPP